MQTMTKFSLYSLIASVAILAFAAGLFAAKFDNHAQAVKRKIQASFDATDSLKDKPGESKAIRRYRILT
ncbi:hypothetical protein LPB67_01340 [Undibacterium sp. Jales W-56]|uniref:hypothetical protein n=1 Tax=Undibacterium sp. Jales W-56 TaxID=2897325 RepID=UPI0021D2B410|nr:hypothetical protein [Undibacterium sp. Jales W-56]MCU6432419.1 hypothetical protein [Undibacterium sp. Jales W-56]